MKKIDQEAIGAYVSEVEGKTSDSIRSTEDERSKMPTPSEIEAMANRGNPRYNKEEEEGYSNNLGYAKILVETLPTRGLFYPDGTTIFIRAARGGEIKHWSTMNDQDLTQLSQVDDILNYIIERCVSVKMPGILGSSWKDLKDIDRFYLLLAVREYTFLNGENELMVPISEGKEIPVTKEMIDFIEIPEKIMEHYDSVNKCFSFNLKTGKTFNMYIPSLGATQWLKNYAQAKVSAREGFDQDFILYAPMLIGDFRRLSQRAYEQMVAETEGWSPAEWSLVSYVRDAIQNAAEAKIKYTEEDGTEKSVPLNFRGGLKAIFTIYDPLSILC